MLHKPIARWLLTINTYRHAHKPKVFGGKIALKAESITDYLLKISNVIHYIDPTRCCDLGLFIYCLLILCIPKSVENVTSLTFPLLLPTVMFVNKFKRLSTPAHYVSV